MPTTRVLYSIDLQKSSLFFMDGLICFAGEFPTGHPPWICLWKFPCLVYGAGETPGLFVRLRAVIWANGPSLSGVKTDQRVQRIRVQPEAGDTRQAGGLLVPAPEPVDIRHGKSGQGADVADDFQAKGEIGGEVP